jgi:hypothetical protein
LQVGGAAELQLELSPLTLNFGGLHVNQFAMLFELGAERFEIVHVVHGDLSGN